MQFACEYYTRTGEVYHVDYTPGRKDRP